MTDIIQKVKNLSIGFRSKKGEEILILKNISQYLLLAGLFFVGTQSNASDLKILNQKPAFLAIGLWLVVIPLSYIITLL